MKPNALEFFVRVVPAKGLGQDRACVLPFGAGHIVVLADGAGGTSGGDVAADAVMNAARLLFHESHLDAAEFLVEVDRRLASLGETTAILAVLEDGVIRGASVGDSEAWLLNGLGPSAADKVLQLTERQTRKPLVGSGKAVPVRFGPVPFVGRLLVGSDGLFDYVRHVRIAEIVEGSPLDAVADALVAAARLASGGLQDDLAVIVAG